MPYVLGCPVGVSLLQQPGQLRRKVRLVCHTVLSNFTLCYCFVWSGMLTCSSKMWSSLPHCAFPDPELVSALVSGVSALLQFRSCPRTPFCGPNLYSRPGLILCSRRPASDPMAQISVHTTALPFVTLLRAGGLGKGAHSLYSTHARSFPLMALVTDFNF